MEQNQILAFFAELIKRLFAKSPLFFKIIQIVGIIIAILTGLPAILDSFHVVLPDALKVLENKIVAIAAAVGTFIAMLTVDRTALVPGNEVVKASHEGKVLLPFTAKAEQKKIEETAIVATPSKPQRKTPTKRKNS